VIDLVIEARARDIGGLKVGRLLPSPRRRMVGPFIFLDHMGPTTHVGDVLPHPHIGLSTVTYLFEGENIHRDSLGSVQRVRAGDLNIMTAGRGIVHSERHDPAAPPMSFHGVQIWVALPEANEDDPPRFEHHGSHTLPDFDEPGVRGRVLIGSAYGVTSPVVHPSQPLLVELALERGGCIEVADVDERGIYVVSGAVRVDDTELAADRLAVGHGRLEALEPSRVLVIGGPAMPKRFIDWNFVASSQERIDRARQAWIEQTFPKIPGDDREFVPLPR
jgi:redox-sensitive bicupin YhaK (pirin superfamily)